MNIESGWFWGKLFFVSVIIVVVGLALGDIYGPIPDWSKWIIGFSGGIISIGILAA
jgi:hypothetical protein